MSRGKLLGVILGIAVVAGGQPGGARSGMEKMGVDGKELGSKLGMPFRARLGSVRGNVLVDKL